MIMIIIDDDDNDNDDDDDDDDASPWLETPSWWQAGTERQLPLRPWPNDSTFHSIFSSTFDLKVERLLSVVEHMWPNGSIFRSTFLSTFQLLIFPQRMSAKNIYHHKYLPA